MAINMVGFLGKWMVDAHNGATMNRWRGGALVYGSYQMLYSRLSDTLSPPFARERIEAMVSAMPDTLEFKTAIKEAMIELLQERGDLFAAIFAEALEDLGLLRAIDAGHASDFVSRGEIMEILDATR